MTKAEVVAEMRIKIPLERKITTEILVLINTAEDYKAYSELGYSTMHKWLVKEFRYSAASASRRIAAAEQLRIVPGIEDKLISGDLNLTTVCMARAAVKAHEKITEEKLSADDQADLFERLENKTTDQVQKTLYSHFPETAEVHPENQRRVSEDLTRHTLYLNDEAQADFEWVRDFYSHTIPSREAGLIFARLCKDFRTREEKKDERAVQREFAKRSKFGGRAQSPQEEIQNSHIQWQNMQAKTNTQSQTKTQTEIQTPHIQSQRTQAKTQSQPQPTTQSTTAAVDPCVNSRVKRVSLTLAKRACQFTNPETGEACGETAWIESDHIDPKALGGSDDLCNRRALCRAHNQYVAKVKLRHLNFYREKS